MADKKTAQKQGDNAEITTEDTSVLQQQVDKLLAENATLKAELQELKKVVQVGAANPTAKAKPEVPGQTFEVEGKTYAFKRAKFTLPANKKTGRTETVNLTATDALQFPAILKELVDLGSGVIAEV